MLVESVKESKQRIVVMTSGAEFVIDKSGKNGMILRNNGNTLVIAPALVITKEEIDMMLGRLYKVIPLAMKHFGL